MYKFYFKLVYIVLFSSCINSQTKQESTKLVGGPCEGCEAIYEYGSKILKPTDTIIGFNTLEPKIKISGVVYKNDGKTPAKDVILFYMPIILMTKVCIQQTTPLKDGNADMAI